MLSYVLDLALSADASSRAVVVGCQAEEVASTIPPGEFDVFRQDRQLGTGHAVRQARGLLSREGDLLILSGDAPLLSKGTLRRLVRCHRRTGAAVTVLTALLPEPRGYGRIIRGGRSSIRAIVEEADATAAERGVKEINTGTYCFDTSFLRGALGRLRRSNRQGEFYLTDVVAMAVGRGLKVMAVRTGDPGEVKGINSRIDLAGAENILRLRKLEALMRSGVTVADPASTWVEHSVRVGRDTVLLPQTFLEGQTRVGPSCRLGPMVRVRHSTLGKGVLVKDGCVIEDARIGPSCRIGPFAHLRPGTVLAADVKIGNFVEVKGSRLGRGTKASHLSYIGDSRVGRNVNIGAGTITCNYDGSRKWRTVIEDGVFIGSNTALVAPVRVGRDSLVGAGSTITRDIPPGTLALSRTAQEHRRGGAKRRLGKRKSGA
jgi:bifunctional UDP-N-acetylglucosamine pyrophosphorylase/glucosamine-1-phosphate N-acetyltransferase